MWADAPPIDLTLHPGEVVGIIGSTARGRLTSPAPWPACSRLSPAASPSSATTCDPDHRPRERPRQCDQLCQRRSQEGRHLRQPVDLREPALAGLSRLPGRRRPQPRQPHQARPGLPLGDGEARGEMGGAENLITSLSGGNQQKVLIARAFAEKPAVLVLNDPARGIDVGAKLDLYRNLREFAARGNAVLFLSSEIEEVPQSLHAGARLPQRRHLRRLRAALRRATPSSTPCSAARRRARAARRGARGGGAPPRPRPRRRGRCRSARRRVQRAPGGRPPSRWSPGAAAGAGRRARAACRPDVGRPGAARRGRPVRAREPRHRAGWPGAAALRRGQPRLAAARLERRVRRGRAASPSR